MFDFSHLFTFNGVDYTLYILVLLSFVTLFSLQYFLCAKIKNKFLRNIPFIYVFLLLVFAFYFAFIDDSSGFFDLSFLLAILLLVYAGICLFAIVFAKISYKFKGNFVLKLLGTTGIAAGLFIIGLAFADLNNNLIFIPAIAVLILGIVMLVIAKFKH